MPAIKFTNFYSSTLATPPTGTTGAAFTVTSAVGLPTLGAGDWCYVVLKNASLIREIIKIGTISGTTLTPATGGRGADASAAYASWLAGDVIELCAVNASLLDLLYDFKNNFYNVANTFKSVFTNANTAIRTYTFQNRDGTIADITDLATKAANGANSDITSLAGLTTPLSIAQGGTSATTAAAARAALGAAASGANGDISTLSAVTLVSNTGAQLQLANNTQINCTNVAGSAQVPVLAGNASVAAHLIALGQTLSDLSAGSGYIKLPVWTGAALRTLIIQYATGVSSGSIAAGGNASQTINWPIAFPAQCSFALAGLTSGTPHLLTVNVISTGTTGGVINVSNPSSSGTYASTPRVIAFGY